MRVDMSLKFLLKRHINHLNHIITQCHVDTIMFKASTLSTLPTINGSFDSHFSISDWQLSRQYSRLLYMVLISVGVRGKGKEDQFNSIKLQGFFLLPIYSISNVWYKYIQHRCSIRKETDSLL